MFIDDHSTVLNYSTSEFESNKYEIQLTNDFANVTYGSGLFNISGTILSNSSYKRIYAYFSSSGFPKTVTAVTGLEQIYPPVTGTPRVFNRWINTQASNFTINTAQNIQETASFENGYKVTFSNSYGSSFTDGIINADGQQKSSPYSLAIKQGNSTTASAINQNKYVPNSNNYIELTLDHWSATLPVTPTQNDQTYYCYLKGKPVHTSRNLRANDSSFGSNVQLTWNEFNDPDITGYQIWRRVKHNGVLGDPVMLAFVSNRYTTSYIDYDYVISQYLVDLLKYDVRAVCDPGYFNGWDQPAISTEIDYIDVFGQMSFFTNSDNNQLSEISFEQGLPSEYSMSNYPNPFNPTTTINYQLPESGFVTVKVFDILGKEVTLLVNENKSAGYYTVNFNGSNLTSGVYIYTIQVNGITQSKKMLQTK